MEHETLTNDGVGSIAVVDDEVMIGRVVETAVGGRYEVRIFTDPREFLDVISEGERFALVFCDINMPHLSGMDVYRGLRDEHPDVADQMVIITGGVVDGEVQQFLDESGLPVLFKPFTFGDLRICVDERMVNDGCRCGGRGETQCDAVAPCRCAS